MKTILALLVLVIIGAGYFIWWDYARWIRYVSEYSCVQTGRTRETSIPIWVSTGNGTGFLNYVPEPEYEYKCLHGRIWQ